MGGQIKLQDESGTLCVDRKYGSLKKKKKKNGMSKSTGANPKEPPTAKAGTIWETK